METNEILTERGSIYGAFEDNARITQAMYIAAMTGTNVDILAHAHREAIHMILHKISRIVNGNPNHVDSWDDIAGYAKLVSNYIQDLPQPGTVKYNPSMPIKPISEAEKDEKGHYL